MTDGLPGLLRHIECGKDSASDSLSVIITTGYLTTHLTNWKDSIIKSINEKEDDVPCAAWL